MSKKKEVDSSAGKAFAGLLVLVAGVAGFGWWRSRATRAQGGVCKLVEESVYRGFKYRIEQCPLGEGHGYVGIVPIQQVGSIQVTQDEGSMLQTVEDARKYAQMLIDQKLGPLVQAVFVGANR